MKLMNPSYLQIAFTFGAMAMAVAVLFIRLKASRRPVTVKKIVIPPLGMTTGLMMFIVPETHIPILWGVIAFAFGWLLFSYPLIRTTKFEKIDGEIYAERSRSFILILIGLLVVRLLLHEAVEQYVSVMQTAALFFLLAYGMIIRWRLFMFKQYRAMTENAPAS
ncbi:cytochrome c biogenesis protein CcdC [Paenibacillus timonensis]|jgi:membrane protein CcdC involved in cytochrome C biogenesis|uniref:CcdC family protein n=1 Tax=Paenibacillus timonensis TaxID=225915 RepID=A0ABW3SHC5_9BACL|nr:MULTISPECIES: cytochrome c biogenesis protein CcdC [Paenibacillus]MCH1643017.1 cytochrome c biogenesis protein CcdC [Paenibacillus timonensis]MDU2241619.1 cytochrome c biogenesis protein CcdC [Paenibacillus sp.]GJM83816.1 membrane protein [Paenibacillus sp. HMSSN-139]